MWTLTVKSQLCVSVCVFAICQSTSVERIFVLLIALPAHKHHPRLNAVDLIRTTAMAVTELTSLEQYRAELSKPGVAVIAPHYEAIANKTSNSSVRFFKVRGERTLECFVSHTSGPKFQVNGLEEPGSTIQKAAEVVWWPTLVVYEDGKETWREKVPNPPSIQPIRDLDALLDEKSGSQ
ncbi:hypothetical protein VTK73DRAFT_7810 [Phialemonium thermophilum]|uniref:Thioredoxin domain-containing protein n=1 Tax=Phialemonium thermophilum TaxID=223376 RepID=A0ABR3WCA2_9PEZI